MSDDVARLIQHTIRHSQQREKFAEGGVPDYDPMSGAQIGGDASEKPAIDPQSRWSKFASRLTGTQFGEPRYQLWPEKMVRSGVSLAGDVLSGSQAVLPPGSRREDYTDIPPPQAPTEDSTWLGRTLGMAPVGAQPNDPMMERAQDMAGLAGGQTLLTAARDAPAAIATHVGADSAGPGAPLSALERIHHNPGRRELDAIMGGSQPKSLRGLVDDSGVYTWDSATRTHHDQAKALGLDYNIDNRFHLTPEDGGYYKLDIGPEWAHNPEKVLGNQHLVRMLSNDKVLIDNGSYGTVTGPEFLKTLASDSAAPGAPLAALEHAPKFYSGAERAVEAVPQQRMTGAQWIGTLSNKGAVKAEEMQWTGLGDFLLAKKDTPVTKVEVQEHLGANRLELGEVHRGDLKFDRESPYALPEVVKAARQAGETPGDLELVLANDGDAYRALTKKFPELSGKEDWAEIVSKSVFGGDTMPTGTTKFPDAGYQLPGGENYREKLLTLPVKKGEWVTQESPIPGIPVSNKILDRGPVYHSSHWDEPNVLVHRRTNERDVVHPLSTEEKQAVEARKAAQGDLDKLRADQNEVARKIQVRATPFEEGRKREIMADLKAGKITRREALAKVDEYVPNPDLKPLQDRLQELRAQEDQLRDSLPPEPKNSKRSLHIEEVQSDWHQQGRKDGYVGPAISKEEFEKAGFVFRPVILKPHDRPGVHIVDHHGTVVANGRTEAEAMAQFNGNREGVPDAPFKKNWHELALKDAIREAAEKGIDRISWTPGEAQAARYDLSKQVDRIGYTKRPDGKYNLTAEKDGNPLLSEDGITLDRVGALIGKDMAQKIEGGEGKVYDTYGGSKTAELTGLDLKVGGEGMKGFYDKMIPDALNKIGKPHGVKVEKGTTIHEGDRAAFDRAMHSGDSAAIADAAGLRTSPVHYMDIPPSLREQALKKGFSLFEDSAVPGAGVAAAEHATQNPQRAKNEWWHGSPSGDLRGGPSGLHLGTKAAAQQALEARIGIPADGKGWTGERTYGETLLAGQDTLKRMDPRGYNITGHNVDAPKEDYYPTKMPTYGDGTAMSPNAKPTLAPYRLTGAMSNSHDAPHPDFKANGYMRGQLKRGAAMKGYYYKNVGEDSGSVSITVPSAAHVEKWERDGFASGGRVGYEGGGMTDDDAPVFNPARLAAVKPVSPVFDPAKLATAKPREAAPMDAMDVVSGAIENAPASAWQFAKDVARPVTHPIETLSGIKDLGLGLLEKSGAIGTIFPSAGGGHEQYADAMGQYLKNRYGGLENIKRTVAKDPVGALSDASMVLTGGGSAAARLPGALGRAGEITGAVGRAVDPILAPVNAARAGTKAVGELMTHTGATPLENAYRTGVDGGEAGEVFRGQMRGTSEMTEPVQMAKEGLEGYRGVRARDYREGRAAMTSLDRQMAPQDRILDFGKIDDAVDRARKVQTFGTRVLDKGANEVRNSMISEINEWKALDPVEYHTIDGMDALKRSLGHMMMDTAPGTSARKAAGDIYNAVRKTIVEYDPKYAKVMKDYEQASTQIKELERSMSLGEKASADTALRKLQSIMRNNVNTNYGRRLELGKLLEENGATHLMAALSGQALNAWAPRGLGKLGAELAVIGGAGHFISPWTLAATPLMSPRLMGEVAHAAGRTAGRALEKTNKAFSVAGLGGNRTAGNVSYRLGRATNQSENETNPYAP